MATVEAVAAELGLRAFKKAGDIVIDKCLPSIFSLIDSKVQEAKTARFAKKAIEKYQKSTFDRCSHIKTIINRGDRIDLLDIYVELKFKNSRKMVDQIEFIQDVKNRKMITISGTGGSGKSLAMKYLWLFFFAYEDSRIPVYLELRDFNSKTNTNLIILIADSVFPELPFESGRQIVTEMLKNGNFAFFFDGFDEVSESKKKETEAEIVKISELYDNNIFVISTRPREHVLSWQKFFNYDVAPLDENQVVELVRKISYDDEVKSKFISAVKKNLYKSHKSFLSIPLLVNMMVLTFSDIAEFPSKMHIFYRQAFWALFKNHDAKKEAWSREQSSGLDIEDFQSVLAALCYITNKDHNSKFSEKELIDGIDEASRLSRVKINPIDFKNDLINNVCLMLQDGLYYIFIHRSFQEYFAALFVESLPESEWITAVSELPLFPGEGAVHLLYNMSPKKFDTAVALKCYDDGHFSELGAWEWLLKISSPPNTVIIELSIESLEKDVLVTIGWFGSNKYVSIMQYYIFYCCSAYIEKGIQYPWVPSSETKIEKNQKFNGAIGSCLETYWKHKNSLESRELVKRGSGAIGPFALISIKGKKIVVRNGGNSEKMDVEELREFLLAVGYLGKVDEYIKLVREVAVRVKEKREDESMIFHRMLKKHVVGRRRTVRP